MKKYIPTLVMALGLSTALAPSPVLAQSGYPAIASIPFAFEANGKLLTSGTYAVAQRTTNCGVFLLTNEQTRNSIFVMGQSPSNGKDDPKLVFNRYGDHYYLSQIWIDGIGYTLSKSRHEKEMAALRGVVEMATVSVRLSEAVGGGFAAGVGN